MKTTIVKEINSQGRLQLSKDICNYVGVRQNSRVVISKGNNENELYIIEALRVYDFQEVIAFSKVDDKFRVIIPKAIREDDSKFEISATKKAIIIRSIKSEK